MMSTKKMMLALMMIVAAARSTTAELLGSVSCPNGHSDCVNVGGPDQPHYCAFYQNTAECWPCTFCTFFQDSIDGSCDMCSATNTPIGEAPGEAVTDSPTPAPTTTAPTPAPTVATTEAVTASTTFTCPRNCGDPTRGGGHCRPSGRCLSCNDNRILVSGSCYQSVSCKNRKVQSGSRAGNSCRCTQDTCNFCSLTLGTNPGEIAYECRACRDNTYLLNKTCHASCPAHMTSSGIGSFKRRCEEPFTCFGGSLVNRSVSYGCKCPNPDGNSLAACHSCEFRAGEFGQRCTICKSRQFLYQEACISQCPPILGIISYIPGSWRRECRAPFTCTNGLDEQGQLCKCSKELRLAGCLSCTWDQNGSTCIDP